MRIGIDISWAQGSPSGTASYIEGLVHALAASAAHNELVLLTRSVRRLALPGLELPGLEGRGAHTRIERVAIDAPLTNVRQQVALPLALRRLGLDLYHAPAFFLPLALPLLWPGPTVLGVFDLNFLHLRENRQPGRRAEYLSLALQVPLAARQATRIVTLSHSSAVEITRLLHVPGDKVTVIPVAPRDIFRRPPRDDLVEQTRDRYGSYYLMVGVLAPQKNVERVLRAFAALGTHQVRLVLAGRSAGDYAERVLRPLARSLGIADRVVFAGAVGDDEVVALYHGALGLVFPSLGEGFGLPIVEAMVCGCPVITSDRSSMPEVAGDAAVLVDPTAEAAIGAAMARLADESVHREDLTARGLLRGATFTWDTIARETLRCYEQAIVDAGT